ncbi:6-bladed beta-propeller [Methanocalculus chunghsingensis]|uniref:6-bladed beta-propeller n=1 Tax=Methanocalculus chunghsingensis TaxID=156457 RepID=UPI001B8AF40A|nr:6-bladed beta-propeller [Methanocalculus chunghsingensis]
MSTTSRYLVTGAMIWLLLVFLIPGTTTAAHIYVDSFNGTMAGSGQSGGIPLANPYGVAVDSLDDGNVYVADTQNHRVVKFDPFGTVEWSIGTQGSGERQFHEPKGIVVDNQGFIYIADTKNHRIVRIDRAGGQWRTFGSFGSANGEMKSPGAVAVDDTYLYVADTENHRIQILNKDGSFVRAFGQAGTINGTFRYPVGISVDSSMNIYVMDQQNFRVQVFDINGVYQRSWASDGYGILINEENNIFSTDWTSNLIRVTDNVGGSITAFGDDPGISQLDEPRDIGIKRVLATPGRTPFIYVADTGNNRISIWAPEGSTLPPIADFEFESITPASVPHGVWLNDTSSSDPEGRKPTTWRWEVSRDGGPWGILYETQSYEQRNYTHEFTDVGTYSVRLTVRNGEGTDTITKSDLFSVTAAPHLTFDPDQMDLTIGQEQIIGLWLDIPAGHTPNDLSGFNITLSLSNDNVKITDVRPSPLWNAYEFQTEYAALPGSSVWVTAVDLNGESGRDSLHLFDLVVVADSGSGSTVLTIEKTSIPGDSGDEIHIADREGGIYRPVVNDAVINVEGVLSFPRPSGGLFPSPTARGIIANTYEDLDGNGRIGFNDVVIFWNNMDAIATGNHGTVDYYNYDGVGGITTNDMRTLYRAIE